MTLQTLVRAGSALLLTLMAAAAWSQTSDDAYRKPLKDVLHDIEARYHVILHYADDLVKDRWVTYAGWRFRGDVEKTLANVLAPQDMAFTKTADGVYKVRQFEYHRRSVEEGKEQLDYLQSLYHDVASWEKRKDTLRACMREALRLSPLPPKPATVPIVTAVRKMNGYTVQNIAIETLPGVFVCGSLYRPAKAKGKIPVILCPNGHFNGGRYRPDQQYRCATLARMGAMAFSYDLFAWGESLLQFKTEDHRRSLAMSMQALNSFRILDYLTSLKDADASRVGMTGASGGGSQTMLITALDERIKVSAPVVMLSCYFSGGCPCETGLPVHLCGGETNNCELAAMAAPRPQLIVSDGKDWTDHVPQIEFPYLQKMYGYYNHAGNVQHVHLADEGHDYGLSKRAAMYTFMAPLLGLDLAKATDKTGATDESAVTIEEEAALYVFGKNGENLPARAVKGFDALQKVFDEATAAK